MITLYYVQFKSQWTELEYQKMLSSVPVLEQDRNLKFVRWQDRQAHLLGKLLLQHGLKAMHIHKTLSDLRVKKNGKPYFQDGPYFNISHSGQYAICVISTEGEVGVDVEEIKDIDIIDFKFIYTEQEWSILEKNKNNSSLFYEFWTKKEAVLKANGRGLSIPLNKVEVIDKRVFFMGQQWFLNQIPLDPFHICHIALSKQKDVQIVDCKNYILFN